MLECSTTWTWCPGLVWITGPCAAGCSPSRRTTARRSSTTTGTTHLMSLRLGITSIKIKCRFTKISVIGLTPKGVESQKNWQNDHLFRTICGRKKCLLNILKTCFDGLKQPFQFCIYSILLCLDDVQLFVELWLVVRVGPDLNLGPHHRLSLPRPRPQGY